MKLNKNNIKEWLKKLDVESNKIFGHDLSFTLCENQWLTEYEGMTPEEVVDEEVNSCL